MNCFIPELSIQLFKHHHFNHFSRYQESLFFFLYLISSFSLVFFLDIDTLPNKPSGKNDQLYFLSSTPLS